MVCKCVFLVCSLFLLSGKAEDSETKVELGFNLEKQDLLKTLTESFDEIQALLEERMAINKKILAHIEEKEEMLEDLKDYMTDLDESSVGESHIEVGPAMNFIEKYLEILEKEKAKVSGDEIFDEAWYGGNEKTSGFGKAAVKMISKEVPVIKAAE